MSAHLTLRFQHSYSGYWTASKNTNKSNLSKIRLVGTGAGPGPDFLLWPCCKSSKPFARVQKVRHISEAKSLAVLDFIYC